MRRFFLLTMLLIFVSFQAFGEENERFVEAFEDESAFAAWDGGFFEEGKCFVLNPYGEENDGTISHILSYMDTVPFETGVIYKLSFDAVNLGAEKKAPSVSGIRFGDGARNIVFEFGGIPEDEARVSQFFMVPESGEYSFSLELKGGMSELGFMVDNIYISRIDVSPGSLTILGERTLTIPAAGVVDFAYRLGAYSADGEIINILSEYSTITAIDLPAGVSFSPQTNVVTVSEYCPDNASFTLECVPPDFLALESVRAEITLSKNVFKNSDFSMGSEFWSSNSDIDVNSSGGYVSLYADEPCPYGKYATLRPTYSAVLMENVMYVLRARVRVEGAEKNSVYSQNAVVSREGEVVINILDLYSGGWVDVVAAFRPEVSGLYDVCVNFVTTYGGVVDVSGMTLSPELPEETFITLHAPGNISVPPTQTVFPFSVFMRDQSGAIMDGRCNVNIYPENQGVELINGGIVVSPEARFGEYEITARQRGNPNLSSTLSIVLSNSNIGDGGFEERKANEWWAAASPATLRIEGDPDGRYARISCDDDFAVLINNSYMHLYKYVPYAFKGDILYGDGHTVTVFIESVDGERVPLVQSAVGAGEIFELFQTETDLVGRLMLYIESEEGSVDIALDDLELFGAIVRVSAPKISGLIDSGAMIRADFDFYNNMDENNDSSDCVVSWYTMDQVTGEAEQIGSGRTLKIPGSALGKYIYCDVTPVCKLTGLSGSTLRSIPVLMGAAVEDITVGQPTLPNLEEKDEPSLSLRPVKLPKELQTALPFSDMEGHWAREYVHSLYEAGVVCGKNNGQFAPEEGVTRGELAALVCRAFAINGGSGPFRDVAADSWYSSSVYGAYCTGIMKGINEISFAPEEYVTREQLATVLVRAYEKTGQIADRNALRRFYDSADISSWAAEGVAKGLNIGVINGYSNSTFMPKGKATRAETCVMLARLLDVLEDAE